MPTKYPPPQSLEPREHSWKYQKNTQTGILGILEVFFVCFRGVWGVSGIFRYFSRKVRVQPSWVSVAGQGVLRKHCMQCLETLATWYRTPKREFQKSAGGGAGTGAGKNGGAGRSAGTGAGRLAPSVNPDTTRPTSTCASTPASTPIFASTCASTPASTFLEFPFRGPVPGRQGLKQCP